MLFIITEVLTLIFGVLIHILQPKRMKGGSGLGLSIVYGMINYHNGYLQLESNLGEGTTFKVHLPLIKADDAIY